MDEMKFENEYEIEEYGFISLLKRMLANDNYHFPLSIAEREYRESSYQMSSASQLEDLFIDSLETYIRQNEPATHFSRAILGEREWDYRVNGLTISHKAMLKVTPIALIWDATLKLETWDSKYPFLIDLARSSKKVSDFGSDSEKLSVEFLNQEAQQSSQRILLVHWPLNGKMRVLDSDFPRFSSEDFGPQKALFNKLWSSFVNFKKEYPSNELDFVLVKGDVEEGAEFELLNTDICRSGFYLIPKELLQSLPVVANNKAQLLDTKTVRALLQGTLSQNLVVPTTTWIQYFVGDLKKDLYFKQRGRFEEIVQKFTD